VIGTHLGERYELTTLNQEGPIFSAYSAKDKVLGREVTVRVLKPPFSAEYRFVDVLQEIVKRAGSVRHPNVERLIELQQDVQAAYLVSEASRGSGLSDRIRKLAPYSVPVAVGMVLSILDGLEAIHNSGYVHGDAGAHNIVIQADGAARLEMAGIWEAYVVSETAGSVMLPAMAAYLAPEVSSGAAPTPAADTYALGVILFQLLTGKVPYPADTAVAMAMKHATTAIPSARALNPAVPATLDDFIRRALAKEANQRYPDATRMLADLRKIEDSVRFGKAAAPVSKAAPAPEPVDPSPMASLGQSRSGSVAPAGKAGKARATYVEEREPRDVPIWMTVLFTFFLAVAVSLVGVWYFFTMNAPKALVVPDVRGKTSEDARAMLDRMKLQMRVQAQETSEKVPRDSVVDVDPAPGQQVREGGTVAVILSSGSKLVSIPDLRGKSPDDARSILQKFGLELDRTDPVDDPKIAKGMIVRQNPSPRSKVERFTRVNVWVSTGPPPDANPAPSPTTPPISPDTKFLYTIRIKLTKITDPVVLRVDIADSNGTRKIYEAQRYPNEEVAIRTEGFGEHAVFRIYYNGQLVTQVSKQADEASGGNAADNGNGNGGNGDNGDNQDNGVG
jgi:hypothetical protein